MLMEMQIPNCERVSASGLCPAILAAMSRIQRQQLYRNPVNDTVTDWKPMKGIPHEFTYMYMAELGDTTDQSSSGSEYATQILQANIRETKIKRRVIVL